MIEPWDFKSGERDTSNEFHSRFDNSDNEISESANSNITREIGVVSVAFAWKSLVENCRLFDGVASFFVTW